MLLILWWKLYGAVEKWPVQKHVWLATVYRTLGSWHLLNFFLRSTIIKPIILVQPDPSEWLHLLESSSYSYSVLHSWIVCMVSMKLLQILHRPVDRCAPVCSYLRQPSCLCLDSSLVSLAAQFLDYYFCDAVTINFSTQHNDICTDLNQKWLQSAVAQFFIFYFATAAAACFVVLLSQSQARSP